MNYNGNMPDWHQYNPSQSGINDVTSTAQNVNSGHLSFISNISPTCPTQLNSLNLSSEGFEKPHQNDPNFNPRHFQPHLSSNISHGHNAAADNTPLASMVQMQNCIGHYGPSNTRNPMVENPMDPRNAPIGGLNEELGYRNNQVPLNGPISHLNGPNVMNMNPPPHGSIGPPRNTNVNSHAAGRTAGPPPSFVPCKGLCCNPDPNISYQQWEKYCSYQNNATYRDNVRPSAGYQTDARRFNNDYNFRKDNFDGKETLSPVVPPPNGPNADHRRNFPDFKYRKDRLLSRNYPPSSGMLQNYPMQGYNYTGEYQKYPYNVKEYSKMSGMNVPPNQGMVKHQEQGFAMPQQKQYNSSKQAPYQSSGGTMIPSGMPSTTNVPNPGMIPSAQNTYFNSQYPRNLPTESTTHDCQETTAADNVSMVNRMQTSAMHVPPSPPRYQIFQQKIAMQRFSMENNLRELTRIPGYQSHPKYKECIHRYREIMKLQQSITYQGPIQQTPPTCVTASTGVNASAIPPINLQFDQNGVLINSSYIPEAFPRIQPSVNPQAPQLDNSADKQVSKQNGNGVPEMANRNIQKPERLISQQHNSGLAVSSLCTEANVQKQDGYPAQKSQFELQKTPRSENFNNTLNTNAGDSTAVRQKMSKEFADKPELDVRQFLATWDESEDEDGASNNLSNAILSESTPVVVVGYENMNLSAKTLKDLNGSKSEEITSNVITFENRDKSGNIDVVPTQDCLTIYSTAESINMSSKDSTCKEIISKENIVRPGSHIIQCISNGPDEVPTIHIVDNLEIGSILQVANGQTVAGTLEGQEAVSFFREGTEVAASSMPTLIEVDKKTEIGKSVVVETEYNADLGGLTSKDIVESSSPPKTVMENTSRINDSDMVAVTLPTSMKDNTVLDAAQDMNLKKQSSFASEESHNPDDISLPDLPTSECTPISTTLNTPIHSDNEESSESRVDDHLTIPTNPIEIIQNSPMISFTQSPTKGEPYDHLSDEQNKSIDSSESEYRPENHHHHFKNDKSNNMLDHDPVLGTFEFSTNIEKNESAKNGKERPSTSENNSKNNNSEKVFSLDDETETATPGMTLISAGEYELKIVGSTGTQQSKPVIRDYKNSTSNERHANESQAASSTTTSPDAHKQLQVLSSTDAHKQLQVLSSTDAHKQLQVLSSTKATLRYANSMELNNIALQSITNEPDSVELDRDINYSRKKCMFTYQTISLSTNEVASRNSKLTAEDDCSKTIKSSLERNKATIDAKDSKSSRRETQEKKSISDQRNSHKKRCLSAENTDKLCGETIVHHKKYTQGKEKLCSVDSLKKSKVSHNKPKVIENVSIDDSGERMRLLKEYRRLKYKSPANIELNKNKDAQEGFDYTTKKKLHSSPNPDEVSLKSSSNKQVYQKDVAWLKSSEEQERKRILKTFVAKNINPDFAIQVTNVNLKLKDNNDHQTESQHVEEEVKTSGSLDAIKIEINVSCTERNTTEKLLHENIKNAVAETIGHLTNSISNGARSNSTSSITEIQCEKKTICDKDSERHNRSPNASTETYTEDPTKTEVIKHNAISTAYKEDSTNDETSGSLKKRRGSSLLEGDLINDIYEDKGNVDTEAEPEISSALETSKLEQTEIRRRSLHEESDRKVAAINFCSEELKTSSDNSPCVGSTSRNVSVQKKEHQEMTPSCKSARSFQDDITSRLNAIPSTSSSTVDPNLENISYDNPAHFDYNHFDVAPNENADASAKRIDRWKRSKRDDSRYGSNFDLYETASGYVNPTFFSANELENLNTVPVYTTTDGKITYSPNPRFTYRELIMEARANENYDNTRESYFTRSPSYDYYNCSKLRKVFKRNHDVASGRKREISPVNQAKSAARHIDHLPNKNVVHKSALCTSKTSRNTSHLEFFNDDADKLYTSRSNQQESKENNRKNIVDLSFLEKQYNLDNESVVKHCKTKVLTDNLAYEKGHSENSVFESNLFLVPKPIWEETMESVKSYSSHVDRRNSDSLKELNFSEIFAAQKRSDSLAFLSTEQDDSSNINKTICTTANEPTIHRPASNYIEDLDSIRDGVSQGETQLNIVSHKKAEENECDNRNDSTLATEVNNKSVDILDTSLNMQRNDEYATKQETQSDEINLNDLFTEKEESSSKVADEKIYDSEKDQYSTNNVKGEETLITSHVVEDDTRVCSTPASPKKDKSDAAEDADAKQSSNKSCVEVASTFELSAESKNMLDESKCTETVKDSTLTLNKQDDEVNDSMKDNSDSPVSQEIVPQHDSSTSIDREDSEKVASATESIISTEIDQTNKQSDEQNSAVCKLNESIIPQNPSDIVSIEQSLNEEGDEQQKPENDEVQETEDHEEPSLKDEGNDEVDHCNTSTITSTPTVALDLPTKKDICDLFANEKREQNISEFTVIKSIINGDKKQHQEESEKTKKENPGDCDISIDSKLLCIDSSDCGIYGEDRCPLVQMSEHVFTEEDSMVPMEWETSQIQEDAVNRLCSIDESSIDFTGATSPLHGANSLLDNLSLSRTSIVKESRVFEEAIAEIASKPDDESNVSAIESAPMIQEEFKATPMSNDKEDKEQDQVSSSNYEKVAYLRATDCNANTKLVPKLVIKKSEVQSSKFVTKVGTSSLTQLDSTINKSLFKPGCQPKIPKMIIRNARSRPTTPSIEAVHEEAPPAQVNILDRTLLANEELYENDSENSLQDSSSYRNKIPKMKIKLDEKHSNKIVRADDTTEVKRKNIKKTVPKVKIKSSSRNDLSDNSVSSAISQESKDPERYEEKIPVLKLRKQERNRSSSPEVTGRKRQSSCHPEVPSKRCKKSGRDETGYSTRRSNSSDSMRTIASECETRKNPLVCISEKIPKVIIKRTSASAEFKCELSKGCKNVIAKSAKWQPEVKLERYRILDSMVKDLKLTLSPISLRTIDKIFSRKEGGHRVKDGDYKLSRSNSTSDLLPVKCKQRRMSDYDCRKSNDALNFAPSSRNTDSGDVKICTPKKNRGHGKSIDEYQKDSSKHRSRSHDNNPRAEVDVSLSDKEINQLFEKSSSEKKTTLQCDEPKSGSFVTKADEETIFSTNELDENIPVKHSSSHSTDFKLALKELKTMSKMETCLVKVSDLKESLSEEINLQIDKKSKEQDDDDDDANDDDDDVFLDKDGNDKIVIKKERLSNSDDVDNECILQDDIGLLKDDPASMLDNFVMDNNSVIKIESSDESQSTIEILPASPDGADDLESHMIDDGDSEQLYSADAIPTQFELELEITDTDLLDVPMPKLNPITDYSSRRASTEESHDDQKTRCKFETLSRSKSLLEKDKPLVEINSDSNRFVPENNSVDFIREISLRASCDKASIVTRDNFCCNDSLIKEVLAAKETLKKCLSKSRCENQNARPKTVAEKKQGSSFDLNSLSETTYSSDGSSQGCNNDVTSQKDSTPSASRADKTENIPNTEKSDKKHSKQSKNSFVKRKIKSPEKKEKADTKETMEDTRECTTISLKSLKQFGKASSNESLSRTIYLSEKRRKDLTEQSDDIQSQDPQRRDENKLAFYKIPKISKSTDQERNASDNTKEIKIKEDNMPILEPEITVNFDTSCDRDNSRSPPVITIQDNEDLDVAESKLIDDKIISDKIENDAKDVNEKSEMSVASFITQLAYHEKATIKHRRYCNLCERWFPTTSRHRRHLAGYQHRHIELTQRRSIHALFMLFTGKPCPRLLPANVARSDCSVGELTPLQIAVQDVIKSFDCTQQSPKKQNDVDKK